MYCIVLGGESVPTIKIEHCDTVALRKLQTVKDQDTGFPNMYNLPYQSLKFLKKYCLES